MSIFISTLALLLSLASLTLSVLTVRRRQHQRAGDNAIQIQVGRRGGRSVTLDDEGQRGEEQSESDEFNSGWTDDFERCDTEADRSQDPEDQVPGDSHTSRITPSGSCSHGVPWDNMSYSHWMEHKVDHP